MKRLHEEECFKEGRGLCSAFVLLAALRNVFSFINSQVMYVVYLLFTSRITAVSVVIFAFKTPLKPPAKQATRRTLIFASSSRVTALTKLLPPGILQAWFSRLSVELDCYKIRPGESSYSEQNYAIPHKPGCKIEKTEATRYFLAKQHEVQQTGGIQS